MDLMTAFERFGIAGGVLIVLLLFIWRAGKWFQIKVAEPFLSKHMALIDKLEKNDDSRLANEQSTAQCLAKLCEHAEDNGKLLRNLACLKERADGNS